MWSSFSPLALLCGSVVHDVLLFRWSSFGEGVGLCFLSCYSEVAFKLQHWLYSISCTTMHGSATTGARVQVQQHQLRSPPACSRLYCPHTLQPHSSPHTAELPPAQYAGKLTGWRIFSVFSITCFYLEERDFCACWTSMPWQPWVAQCTRTTSQCFWIIYCNLHELALLFLFCTVTMMLVAPWISWRDRRGCSRWL